MKKILITIFLSLIITLPPTFVNAASVSEILGESEDTETTSIVEEELEEEGDIKLKIPSQTDNPSYVITFEDPSEEEDGIELEIDGDRYVEIESPYTLPALGIGTHTLKFKYTDDEEASQTLEKTLIIIPRPPTLNSPVIEDSSVLLSGAGLASAELLLTVSTGSKTYQYTTEISESGDWEYLLEEDLTEDIYSVQGITRKYGFASNFSDILTFEVGDIQTISTVQETEISFSFEDVDLNTIKSLTSSNWELLVLLISFLLLGMGLGALFNSLIRSNIEKKSIGKFREKINGKEKEDITLRELFEKEDKKGKKEKTKEKVKKEETQKKNVEKEVKVVSKNDFLKVYKDFDPDKEDGEEKKPKKKKFKISLTSKK